MKRFKKLTRSIFKLFGFSIIKYRTYDKLLRYQAIYNFLDNGENENLLRLVDGFETSHSQLKQDLFVLTHHKFKREGFFVEFGATDGVKLSNTYLLEKEYDWSGILAEPAKCWHKNLRENRNCSISTKCVWKDSTSILEFDEDEVKEFSTMSQYSENDHLSRQKVVSYKVASISLMDLLKQHNAPQEIDYLSIDTEGSEWDIINAFDFNAYNIKIITCEHNKTSNREKIYSYLKTYGYKRQFTNLSKWDDWYIRTGNP